MSKRRIISRDQIELAARGGRNKFEILPSDIVTAEARDAAQSRGVTLLDGPLERPSPPKTDSATNMMRLLWKRSPRWMAPEIEKGISPKRFQKIALVGAGGVGTNVGHLAFMSDIAAEIDFIDIAPGIAESTAMDLNHSAAVSGTRARASGGLSLDRVENADVVVVTAGRARTPGMTRADLIDINRRVIHSAGEAIAQRAPKAIVIVVTNPLDEMTYEMLQATSFNRNQVLGMAGTLDSSRFSNSLAMAAKVDVRDVNALTLGAHGEEMVPVVSRSRIKGRPLDAFLSQEQIAACVKDAVTGGGQVVAIRKTGSATIAPAHSTIQVIDHLRGARLGAVPISVRLEGEFGLNNVVLGVPCHLGMGGVISVDEPELTQDETAQLMNAADAIRQRLGIGDD